MSLHLIAAPVIESSEPHCWAALWYKAHSSFWDQIPGTNLSAEGRQQPCAGWGWLAQGMSCRQHAAFTLLPGAPLSRKHPEMNLISNPALSVVKIQLLKGIESRSFTISNFWDDSNNTYPTMNSHATANRASEIDWLIGAGYFLQTRC